MRPADLGLHTHTNTHTHTHTHDLLDAGELMLAPRCDIGDTRMRRYHTGADTHRHTHAHTYAQNYVLHLLMLATTRCRRYAGTLNGTHTHTHTHTNTHLMWRVWRKSLHCQSPLTCHLSALVQLTCPVTHTHTHTHTHTNERKRHKGTH